MALPVPEQRVTPHLGGEEALVLERVSDAFVALDRDWHYTYVNRKAAQLFARRPEDMIGKHIWTEFPEGVDQPFYHAYQRALARQEFTFIEAYYAPYDRWFENRIYPSADGLSIFFHDVTHRKRAESLLVGQKQVLELIAQGASLTTSLTALVRVVEQHCQSMRCSVLLLDEDGSHLRHGAAPSLPASFVESIDGSSVGPHAGSCGTAAFTGLPVISEDIASDPAWADYRAFALPIGLRAAWSTPIFDECRRVLGTFAMYYPSPGRPSKRDLPLIDAAAHIAAIAITRTRSETALRKSESRYRRLVDSNLIGVMICDLDGFVKEANDEFLRILGSGRCEIGTGLRWTDRVRGAEGGANAVLQRLAQYGTRPPYEEVFLGADGHDVPVMITAAMLDGVGGECVCLVEDIRERKEQERIQLKNAELEEGNRLAQESNRIKSEFLANMSHELRTPLNAIIGFSEFLIDQKPGPLNSKQVEYLGDVLTSGRHLLQLINDVLDLAKVEAGRIELHPASLSMRDTMHEVCAVVRALAERKRLQLALSCTDSADRVTLDQQRLKQVLFNLLANAVKFTEPGGRVEVVAQRFDGERVEIRVCDTGIGIRREDIPKLFQEFCQLDSHASRHHQGTGLGLALTKRIVESQGGTIGVESEPGKGSTFVVILPTAFG
jgi:PAS domain S-box-containing protein